MDRMLRVRRVLATSAPAVAMLAGIVLLVVPIRLGQGYIPTPLLPLIIVFLYSVYDPDALPAPVVFVLGLLHDLLYGGGFGVWASIYLSMKYLVHTQREYLNGRVRRVIWLAFAVASVTVGIVLWLEQSLLAGRWVALWPLVYQFFITIAVYPLASRTFFYLRRRAAGEFEAYS
ncbi:rod shape-determining protein MreD [Parvularcula sp. LCG005]|uniref:rod shape-determining protein MreD n=1 Tax=Parvularcula sp. LCG005 TaxID=3078805 RepID=UPI002943DF91|nr:rod shape-determining protein MreD [Parvularcula sp. LCG005]WOI54116.1 rod shape-determining protein MreD [Parvularcula sp. LCG005]